jgi:hypothetical protein
MIAISSKKKTLVSLPIALMAKGKQVASNHSVTFSEYVAQLLSNDLAEREKNNLRPSRPSRPSRKQV